MPTVGKIAVAVIVGVASILHAFAAIEAGVGSVVGGRVAG